MKPVPNCVLSRPSPCDAQTAYAPVVGPPAASLDDRFDRPQRLFYPSYFWMFLLLAPVPHLLLERRDDLFQSTADLVVDLADGGDFLLQLRVVLLDVVEQIALELLHLIDRHVVEESVDARIDRKDLIGHRHRLILTLFEQFHHAHAPRQLHLGGLIQLAPELRECGHLAILREVQSKRPGHLLHGLDLRGSSDPGDRQTDVDRRADTGVEEIAPQIDLTVRDRNDVRRNVRRHVASLRFDDGKRRETASTQFVAQLGCAFEQPGVQIKYIARIGFASRRPAEQQRKLAVGDRVFRQVVIDDQRVFAVVPEVFPDGRTGKRRQELHRRRVAGAGGDHHAVVHGMVFFERLHDAGHGRALLADGDVDAKDVQPFLIDDRVDRNRGLPRLAVADDQLSLAAPDRDHGVDGFDAGLERFANGLASIHAGRHDFDAGGVLRLDRALAVDRLTDGVHDATHEGLADRNFRDAARPLDRIAFLNADIVAHQHGADIVFFEVQRDAVEPAGKFEHLAGHGSVEAVYFGDAVADLDDGPGLLDIDLFVEAFDLFFDDRTDFVCPDLHGYSLFSRQQDLQIAQATSDGAVDDRTADVDLQAGEVTGIGLKRDIDVALQRVA
jgi:hypothetical protein